MSDVPALPWIPALQHHPRRAPAVAPEAHAIVALTDPAQVQMAVETTRQRMVARGLSGAWATVGVVFEDQYLVIVRDPVRFPDGTLGTYIRMLPKGNPGVAILPVHTRRILVLRHYRHATGAWHWEIPRGFALTDSSSEMDARRELAEETGATATVIHSLGKVHPDTGLTASCVELFYAQVDELCGTCDPAEGIGSVEALTISEFERRIAEEIITDGFTIAAFIRARLRGFLDG